MISLALPRSGSALYSELVWLVLPWSLSLFLISWPLFEFIPALVLASGHLVVSVLRTAAMFSQSRYDTPSLPLLFVQGILLLLVQGVEFAGVISVVFSTLVFFKTDRLIWLPSLQTKSSVVDVLVHSGAVAVSSGLITGGALTFSLAPTLLHIALQISVLLVRSLLLSKWAAREDLGVGDLNVSLVPTSMRPGAPLSVWLGLLFSISRAHEVASLPSLQTDTPSEFRFLLTKLTVKDQISRVGLLCDLATRDTGRAQLAATRELRILADRLGERKLRELAPDPEKLTKALGY